MSSKHRWFAEPYLPLRSGQVGRFLGVYNSITGRKIREHRVGERFTGHQQVRGVPDGARFRNETIGVTYEFAGMWRPVLVTDPNGCRYCDRSRRLHTCNAWADQPGVGLHEWTEPTDQQRLHRMQWRRYLTAPYHRRVVSCPDLVPFTLAAPKKTRRAAS
jgi:hypothetical protein